MQKIQLVKVQKVPFVQIPIDLLENRSLSWKAKALMSYLISRPPNWVLNLQDLHNRSTDGKDAVRSGLQELEKAGYLRRTKDRDESGHFTAKWYLSDFPSFENESPGESETQAADSSTSEKPPRVNRHGKPATNYINGNHIKNIKSSSEPNGSEAQAQLPTFPEPPKEKPKPTKERDPLLDHPAIIAYREVVKFHVPASWRQLVVNAVGDRSEDWRRLVTDWIGNGWNPRNVKGMLNAFASGGIKDLRNNPANRGKQISDNQAESRKRFADKVKANPERYSNVIGVENAINS
jgi:hypothetical protein